jgi:hypothetical protein
MVDWNRDGQNWVILIGGFVFVFFSIILAILSLIPQLYARDLRKYGVWAPYMRMIIQNLALGAFFFIIPAFLSFWHGNFNILETSTDGVINGKEIRNWIYIGYGMLAMFLTESVIQALHFGPGPKKVQRLITFFFAVGLFFTVTTDDAAAVFWISLTCFSLSTIATVIGTIAPIFSVVSKFSQRFWLSLPLNLFMVVHVVFCYMYAPAITTWQPFWLIICTMSSSAICYGLMMFWSYTIVPRVDDGQGGALLLNNTKRVYEETMGDVMDFAKHVKRLDGEEVTYSKKMKAFNKELISQVAAKPSSARFEKASSP